MSSQMAKAAQLAMFGRVCPDNECPLCGCGIDVGGFRDALSLKEYEQSGMCQKCQDEVFGT